MKDSNLKVSVIIPVFNGEQFIQNAVESCLDQNEVNEIILIDDGSTDKTNEICIQLSNQFNKVKFFTHEYRKNKGPGLSRNLGIEKSKNDFIAFLDADDIFLKNRFYKTMKLFETKPKVGLISCRVKNVYLNDYRKANFIHQDIIGFPKSIPSNEVFDYIIGERGDFFCTCGFVVKKSKLVENNIRFDSELKYGEDIDFIYQLAEKLTIEDSEEEPLVYRRLHSANLTSSNDFNAYPSRNILITKWYNKMLVNNYNSKVCRSMLIRKIHSDYKSNFKIEFKFLKWLIKLILVIIAIVKNPKLIIKLI